MAKYYAVRKGRKSGIFTTWAECQEQTTGFKGAEFKSFKTLLEAQSYLDKKEVVADSVEEVEGVYAYIDGSYDKGHEVYGSGIVIVEDGKNHEYKFAGNNKEYAKHHNVAGEIEAAKFVMSYAAKKNISSITIFYDYEGIEKWATGEWSANVNYTKEYKNFSAPIMQSIKVNFVKVKAHTGVELNERVDALAKEAIAEFKNRI